MADEKLDAILAHHWLIFDAERHITRCHCGYPADPADCGWGDSILRHILEQR